MECRLRCDTTSGFVVISNGVSSANSRSAVFARNLTSGLSAAKHLGQGQRLDSAKGMVAHDEQGALSGNGRSEIRRPGRDVDLQDLESPFDELESREVFEVRGLIERVDVMDRQQPVHGRADQR